MNKQLSFLEASKILKKISNSLENATERPVGIKQEHLGASLIGVFIKAIRSIPEAPKLL